MEICNDILNIIENHLIVNSTSEEGKVSRDTHASTSFALQHVP